MRTMLRSKVTLLFMVLGLLVALPAVALADIVIVNEANIVGDQTKKPGATGTARVTLNNQNTAAGDPVNACNAAGSGNQVSVTLAVRDATTGQADNSITFTSGQNPAVLTGCDDPTTATVEAFDDVAYTVSPTATDKTVEIYVANDPNTTQVDGISGGRTGGSYVATDTLRIRIDGTGPAITINTPPADASYDVDEVVNADFECTDPSGVKSCTGTVADGNAINTGSAGTKTFTVNAEDNLGNTSTLSRDYTVVNPDSTPPVITPNISGTLGNNDWYKSDVDLTWSVVDNESAISSRSGCDAVSVTSDQNATNYTCTATSAGGTSSKTVSIKRDASAPNAPTATTNPASPVANSGGFFKDTVTVSYGGSTDVGPSGIAGYSAAQTFNTTGTHNYSGTATDNAGNVSDPVTGSVKVDKDPPTVGITGCPTSAVVLNSTQNITVAASDQANGSGLVSDPSGQVSLDTSSVGQHTKTITVDDKVGHTNSATCTYSVKYNFIGFSSPVDNPGVLNVAKAGSAIPLKWQLLDANGPVTNLSSVNLSVATLACAGLGSTDDLEVYASGSSGLQNLGGGYYQFNWKSQSSYANSCKTLTLDLGEGKDADGNTITHKALFQFKK